MRLIRQILGSIILFLERNFKPKSIERSEEEQRKVDQQLQTMALYQFPACPFCVKVRRTMKRLNLNIELRNVQQENQWRSELSREGGKIQVPCLKIEEADGTSVWMYESSTIVNYLTRRFSAVQPNGRT
jgi:glutaredoxin